jgi:DNA-binding HxlR family transcriptional regulator
MKVSNQVTAPLWEYFPDRVLPNGCPSRVVLDHVTSKWGVLLLVTLSAETLRWGELRRRAQGISEKMLSQTLRTLEQDGLVHRDAQPVIPPRVDYSLTERGRELAALLLPLVEWTVTNADEILGGSPGRGGSRTAAPA